MEKGYARSVKCFLFRNSKFAVSDTKLKWKSEAMVAVGNVSGVGKGRAGWHIVE